MILPDITARIGSTPLIALDRLAVGLRCRLVGKLEAANPGGSVKDRIALPMIEAAEQVGLLRPGGTIVIDAIAATRLAALIVVSLLERIPNGAPPGLHDPKLFVDRRRLLAAADRLGLDLTLVGLRPSFRDLIAFQLGRRPDVRIKTLPITAVLFAGYGRKRPAPEVTERR